MTSNSFNSNLADAIKYLMNQSKMKRTLNIIKAVDIAVYVIAGIVIFVLCNAVIAKSIVIFVITVMPLMFISFLLRRLLLKFKFNTKNDIKIVDNYLYKVIDGSEYKIPLKRILELTESEFQEIGHAYDVNDDYFSFKVVAEREIGRTYLLK